MKNERDENVENLSYQIGSGLIKIGAIIGFFWVLVAVLSILSPLGNH